MIYIFSVEGNIGSGKSTLIKNLLSLKKINDINVVYLQEPIDVWSSVKDQYGVNILEKFYSNQEKYAFPFQMLAFISRVNQLNSIINNNTFTDLIIITERCVFTDREVFAKMLFDSNVLEEICYNIYLKWFDELTSFINITGYIYLATDPETCNRRIISRNRQGENNITKEYLMSCHNYHTDWLLHKKNLLTINTNEIDVDILIKFILNLKN